MFTAESLLVGCLGETDAGDRSPFDLPGGVGWIQVRADRIGDLPSSWLRGRFRGKLLYTLRTRAEGGQADPGDPRRRERLRIAAADHDLVELEAARDLDEEVLAEIPPRRRLLSWRGPAADLDELGAHLRRLLEVEARYYQLVLIPRDASDGLLPLTLLRAAGRRDVVAYADGELGLWSRVLSPYLGSPLVYGSLPGCRVGPGAIGDDRDREPSLCRLAGDYGLATLPAVDRIYGIVGDPVVHSLSPRLHNAAYRSLAHPGLFLSFQAASFRHFHRDMIEGGTLDRLGMPLHGLTVAAPNKEASIAFAAACSSLTERSASANIFFRRGDAWVADTTDPDGVLAVLRRRRIAVRGRRAAVVGCGGSGRAIALALARGGADVTLVNRGPGRGRRAARLLGLPFVLLSGFRAEGYSLIVNATPVGREDASMPFAIDHVARDAVVVDLVYSPEPTTLVRAASGRGVTVVDGREVLMVQVRRQFAMMTGRSMPEVSAASKLGPRSFAAARGLCGG